MRYDWKIIVAQNVQISCLFCTNAPPFINGLRIKCAIEKPSHKETDIEISTKENSTQKITFLLITIEISFFNLKIEKHFYTKYIII